MTKVRGDHEFPEYRSSVLPALKVCARACLFPHLSPRLAPLRQAQGKLWAAFLRRFAASNEELYCLPRLIVSDISSLGISTGSNSGTTHSRTLRTTDSGASASNSTAPSLYLRE